MRRALLTATAALGSLVVASVPASAAVPIRTYKIQGGDLSRALRDFSRQSEWQILFLSQIASGRRTAGFNGTAEATEALNHILEGTGLNYRVANADTLLIVLTPTDRPAPKRAPSASSGPPEVPAREAAPPRPIPQVEEVIVTATRVALPVGRVPLSITAQTQRNLDQQGVRVLSDLVATAPAMAVTQGSPGVSNPILRGIANTQSAVTAPTTGFYLDDTPIHKRNVGGFINNNGTPLPPLFDLDRVEVLRGPQGTLFGGSSEGGTIRYITPQPSLSRTSTYIRAEAASTKDGGPTQELGVALGAPLVQDRLGFRVSVYERNTGGYIDYIDPYTQQERFHDVNKGRTRMFRGALTWAPADDTRVTLSYFNSMERIVSNVSSFTLPIKDPIVEMPLCFNTTGVTAERPVQHPAPVSCNSPGVTYRREGATYGPYPNLKPYDLVTGADPTPAKTRIEIPSLTIERRLDQFTVRAITSYVDDQTRSQQFAGGNDFNLRLTDVLYAPAPPSAAFPAGGEFRQGLGIYAGLPTVGRQGAPVYGFGYGQNKRYGVTQEVRFSASDQTKPFSWVGGVFYSNMHGVNRWYVLLNQDLVSQTFYGLTAVQRYGIGALVDEVSGLPVLYDRQDSFVQDIELAGFGEGNLWITDKIRLTAGIRASQVQFKYSQAILGAAAGFATPTFANRGLSSGKTSESPITPKFGAMYQLDTNNMVYLTAAKGFRPGGVNGVLSPALCDPVLSRFGLTSADVPPTFASDRVWSYELGSKLRLLRGGLQVSGDVYSIDWDRIQTAVNFAGCGSPFVTNAGKGKIKGAELEAQAKFGGLGLDLSLGYTNGRYVEQATSPAGSGTAPLVITLDGQPLPVPPWTLKIGARYERTIFGGLLAYARGDWRWTSGYDSSVFGVPGYSPDTARAVSISKTNVRVGVERKWLDVAVFVTNLFNSHDGNVLGGRRGCTAAGGPECSTYAQYNPFRDVSWGQPRQVGLQVALRN